MSVGRKIVMAMWVLEESGESRNRKVITVLAGKKVVLCVWEGQGNVQRLWKS